MKGALAIPAAIKDVSPAWMVPKTKWLYRRGMPSIVSLLDRPGRREAAFGHRYPAAGNGPAMEKFGWFIQYQAKS
jgi:hypothetical protein